MDSVIMVEIPLIKKILSGSTGSATFDSIAYDTRMLSFAFLNDDEIVGIANYVRNIQGVKYPAASPQNITKARIN
jgi:hypothetical protein